MEKLISINSVDDIITEYRHTPIGILLEYHNFDRPYENYDKAQLLIGMCMDYRRHLHIPDNFAYIIRTGGAKKNPRRHFLWNKYNNCWHIIRIIKVISQDSTVYYAKPPPPVV